MQGVGQVPTCAVLPIPLHKDVGDVETTLLQNIWIHYLQLTMVSDFIECLYCSHLAVVSLNVSLDDVGGGGGGSDGQQVLQCDRLYCSTLHLHNFAYL